MFLKIKFLVVLFFSLLLFSCGAKKVPIAIDRKKERDSLLLLYQTRKVPLSKKRITLGNTAYTETVNNDYLIKKKYSTMFGENVLDTVLVFKKNVLVCSFLCSFKSHEGFKKIDGNKMVLKDENGKIIQLDTLVIVNNEDYIKN